MPSRSKITSWGPPGQLAFQSRGAIVPDLPPSFAGRTTVSCGRLDERCGSADIIEVLDAAYPPRAGAVLGLRRPGLRRPAEPVESVTVAVDATAAVVDDVPDGGLLLAHHPLLLRGVDTVAADTAKGALVHRLIRAGRALFTAHTNADSAAPGVSDALADALGPDGESTCWHPAAGADLDKWVVYVPPENAEAVRDGRLRRGRRPDRRLLPLQLERLRHRAVPAARRRLAGDRQGRHRRAGGRGPGRGDRAGAACAPRCWPRCAARTPTRSPHSTSFALAPLPADVGIGRDRRAARTRSRCRAFVARVARAAARDVVGRARGGRPRRDGVAGRSVRRCG